MSDLSNWTERPFPDAMQHEGRFVRLERLSVARHGDALHAALTLDDGLWTYLPYGPFVDRAGFDVWLAGRAAFAAHVTYTVVDLRSHSAVGVLSLMEIRPASGVVEVGHVAFGPVMQRTPMGSEAICLLARYVFEGLGYRRFEWKCDNGNVPSRRAATRFGFAFEGVFRQHLVVKGRNRDTAWFAMTDGDWQLLAPAYARWLAAANFTADDRQIVALSALTSAALSSPE